MVNTLAYSTAVCLRSDGCVYMPGEQHDKVLLRNQSHGLQKRIGTIWTAID